MKKYLITAMMISLLITLIVPTGCTKPAEFELSSLNISPPEVVKGELTTVTVDVKNSGGSGTTTGGRAPTN